MAFLYKAIDCLMVGVGPNNALDLPVFDSRLATNKEYDVALFSRCKDPKPYRTKPGLKLNRSG